MSQDNTSHTRVLSVDPVARKKQLFHWHADTQNFTIETVRDDEDLLEQNLLERNNVNTSSWKGDMHKVASLPLVTVMELREKGILQDPKAFKRWLNDPANSQFRTRSGRI